MCSFVFSLYFFTIETFYINFPIYGHFIYQEVKFIKKKMVWYILCLSNPQLRPNTMISLIAREKILQFMILVIISVIKREKSGQCKQLKKF